ncbi:hypothetical protein [Pleionea sp. CnH1-48]|uniref:hypothetical protein n=1 Tax=Pleionea sp. CnH1-48 TaxID=2954494 RepID=UPI0020982156|nr:hypothetical protein [Pleionea sp. CnH1-48]MCO7226720.1 hypothetical protein [Pleionea sp. CnH1-48]
MNNLYQKTLKKICNVTFLLMVSAGLNAIYADDAYQKNKSRHYNLDLELTDQPNKGYAFIKQILDRDREVPFVTVSLRNTPTWELPENWTWEVVNPSDNQLKHDLTFKWYDQAACPGDLTHLSVNGPGGYKVQNPLKNPIAGYFNYQSFDHQNIKNICVDWATTNNCDPTDPGCQLYEEFNLVGGVFPVANDLLNLRAQCANGTMIDNLYAPVMTLRCDRSGLY